MGRVAAHGGAIGGARVVTRAWRQAIGQVARSSEAASPASRPRRRRFPPMTCTRGRSPALAPVLAPTFSLLAFTLSALREGGGVRNLLHHVCELAGARVKVWVVGARSVGSRRCSMPLLGALGQRAGKA